MNKVAQNLFQVIYPFYPLWAFVMVQYAKFPVGKVLIFMLLPVLIYYIYNLHMRVPSYLVFYLLFTVYHLGSVYVNDLLPTTTNWFNYFFSDTNVLACILFLVIENTDFSEGFIKRMSRNMLIIIGLSTVVSIIQIKDVTFFYNIENDVNDYMTFYDENRNASIYSWYNLNSVGITFPIMISILLSYYDFKSRPFPLIAISGIIVPFLTRARYVMMSTIIAFSQLLLVKTIPIKKKFAVIMAFVVVIVMILAVSQMVGYDINKIIDERIMEKGNEMSSAKTRLLSYDVFMMKFPENPYYGVGPKTRDDVIDLLGGEAQLIHVGYLSYLYFYGVIGASLLFIALFLLLRDSWLVGRRQQFWGSFYGLLGFAIANFTFVYFAFEEMGIVLAVMYARYYKLNAERLNEEIQTNEVINA
ncbi:MAG: O-antigen ligase family protein [Ferruginibacter sp.]